MKKQLLMLALLSPIAAVQADEWPTFKEEINGQQRTLNLREKITILHEADMQISGDEKIKNSHPDIYNKARNSSFVSDLIHIEETMRLLPMTLTPEEIKTAAKAEIDNRIAGNAVQYPDTEIMESLAVAPMVVAAAIQVVGIANAAHRYRDGGARKSWQSVKIK